jgi:hypothetical protein
MMALDDQELTSNDSQTTPPTGQAPSGDSSPQPSSPEQTPAKVNLFELPDFRAYQSTVARQQEQQRREYEARIAQLEGRMVQAEEAGLDDFEKAQRQNQRLQQQIEAIRQAEYQRQAQQAEQQRVLEDMQLLSNQFGIPIDRLFKASTFQEAFEMGKKYYAENLTAKQQQDVDKRNAHMPDMGQGKPPGASSRQDQKIREAKTSIDLARIMLGRE